MHRPLVLATALLILTGFLGAGESRTSNGSRFLRPVESTPTASTVPESIDSTASRTENFERVILDSSTTRPNELDVAPDGRVFFIEREGAVKVWRPETRSTEMVGFIPVKAIHTNGLLGLALDPDFSENRWMYLYYSPRGDDTRNILARFTVENNRIDPASRKIILEVPFDRLVGGGAHSGGSLAFGPNGHLFLSVGDNTDPTEVALSTPIDERPGREHWDAQRTAGNTMSLRGKILRITPQPEGGYEVPAGNLFPYGAVGRPEIFVMGNRNPFRIAVDPKTGWLYWGDYGPSAPGSEKRGAAGFDEFNLAREPGFYGWPYFVADNKPFRNYNFAADTSGRYYDPERPINDSPNNTGARILPPAQPAMIWYPSGPSEEFPEMGVGGRGPMGGAVYRYDEQTVGPYGLPEYYDGKLFIMEFMRHWIKEVRIDDEGNLQEIKPFLPDMAFQRPFDMDIGPDGSIYLIEWGSNYEGWFNDNARIVRLKYHGTEHRPTDERGKTGTAEMTVTAGNKAPDVTIEWPPQGGIVDFDAPIDYRVAATDAESGGVPDEEIVVQPDLAHDSHWHSLDKYRGSAGSFRINYTTRHLFMENEFVRLNVSYEDGDGPAGRPLRSQEQIILQPRQKDAAFVSSISGAERTIGGDYRWRDTVETYLDVSAGDYASYKPVNLKNINAITFRVSADTSGTIELRLDDPEAEVVGEVSVPDDPKTTGDRRHFQEVSMPVSDSGGPHELFLTFRGPGTGPKVQLMRIDWLRFEGPGVQSAPGE